MSRRRQCVVCMRRIAGRMFGRHIARSHGGLDIQQYALALRDGEHPTCRCGCGQDVSWSSTRGEFCHVVFGHRSPRMRSRTRRFWRSPETFERREKMRTRSSEAQRRRWDQMGPEELRRWRKTVSKAMVARYLDGGPEWSVGYYDSPKAGKVYYRSSYELRQMVTLDADQTVKTWRYEPFALPVRYDGASHQYIPDMLVYYVDGRVEVQEVGVASMKKKHPRDRAKLAALRKFCRKKGWTARLVSFEEPRRRRA